MFKIYFYVNELNDIQKLNLNQLKNVNIIYRNYNLEDYQYRALKLKNFCRLNKFKFFISNDFKLANRISADGLYLPSYNQIEKYHHSKIQKIGSAHNEREIKNKIQQGCEEIFISPVFNTSSGGLKNGKGIMFYKRFVNLFKSKTKINALGGINSENVKSILNSKGSGFASLGMIEKKMSQKIISQLKLIATSQ